MNYIPRQKVLNQFGISLRTLKRWERSRSFPKPLEPSEQIKIYDADQIDRWIKQQKV